MPKNHMEHVIDTLGITLEDVAETMEKMKIQDEEEAFAITLLKKASSPNLPGIKMGGAAPDLKQARIDAGENMRRTGMKYNRLPADIEALTSGAGTALGGAVGGFALGNIPGAIAGAMAGGGIGAGGSYMANAITDNPGEATSYNRALDLFGPVVGGAIGKIPKISATAKSLTNTAADTLMSFMADSKDNEKSATEGKNPLMRAAMTAGIGGVASGITRQAGRQKANVDLLDTLDQMYTPGDKPKGLQDRIYSTLDYEKKPPVTLFGADEKPITLRDKTPSYPQALTNSPDVQKFIRERPGDIYEYVLSPLNTAKNQAELQKAAPQFISRLNTIQKLAGGKEKETLMTGLKNSFIDSIAMSNDNSRISNPDSFKMRLGAMGPEVVDSMMGKDAYPKLMMLSEAASKAGPLGRFSIRFGAGGNVFVAKHIVTLDEDSKITNNALDKGKMLALMTAPLFGKESVATAAGIQAYEIYKIPIDKLLNKTDKKTLAALSSGLMNSTSNSVVNKLTEWFEKNADKKERVPIGNEGPPKLF